ATPTESRSFVMRDDAPATSPAPGTVQDAIAQRKPELVAALSPSQLQHASTQDRLTMIDILLDGGSSFFQRDRLPELWDTFGKGIVDTANANADRWNRSWSLAAGKMRTSREVSGQETYFVADVEDIARGYLDENDQFCKNEMTRLGLDESGALISGPPTAEQD